MKNLILSLLILTGCAIDEEHTQAAIAACENNEGLLRIVVRLPPNRGIVSCNNGAIFELDDLESE